MAALSTHDMHVLNRVQALIDVGRIVDANREIVSISPTGSSHPDVLFIAARLLLAQGRLADARRALEGAIQLVPNNPHYWTALASLLDDVGEIDQAIAAYRNAASAAPRDPDFRINLAIATAAAGRTQEAETALGEAERLTPDSARLWSVRGSDALTAGDPRQAESHLRRSLASDPQEKVARYNLAVALRQLDRPNEALEQIDLALASGQTRAEAHTLRAHLLADIGRFDDAINQYESVVSRYPTYIDAQNSLSRLLPELGRPAEALAHYRAALQATPGDRNLLRSALLAAKELKDASQLIDWSKTAIAQFGPDPEFLLAHAIGLGLDGQHGAAISEFTALADRHPDNVGVSNHIVPSCLAVGDWATAERWASRSAELSPHDLSGWAWLSIIWRLRGDPREAWLADYERLVMPIALEPPPGFATTPDFLARLDEVLTGLHRALAHPADQSLRNGTQTRGNLFDRRIDEIQLLATTLKAQIERRLQSLPKDADHPFLGRVGEGRIAFAASWSVRLASCGFHINHLHPTGWLSSAFYVSLPREVEQSGSNAGALTFGVPDSSLGLAISPRRIIKPLAGALVLFPSYFWHGTIPFESQEPRLTVAFDTQPSGN